MKAPTKAAQRHPQPNHTCYMPTWLMQESFQIHHMPEANPQFRFWVSLGSSRDIPFSGYGPTIAAAAKAADKKRKGK